MIIPVRCFTCGKVIGDLWFEYNRLVIKYNEEKGMSNKAVDDHELLDKEYLDQEIKEETSEKKALDRLKLTRYCCRRHFLCHIDMLPTLQS